MKRTFRLEEKVRVISKNDQDIRHNFEIGDIVVVAIIDEDDESLFCIGDKMPQWIMMHEVEKVTPVIS